MGALRPLHRELVARQRRVVAEGERVLILVEGRDAAGKTGLVRCLTRHLDPHGVRVVSLRPPTPVERTQWYFQRFVAHLPAAGEIVVFDRSWYNRAGLERVMGYATAGEVEELLRAAPVVEQQLTHAGLRVVKLYLQVSRAEQARRLAARRDDPLHPWKLTALDAVAQEKWDEYTAAEAELLRRTSVPGAPWIVIDADDKPRARAAAMHALLTGLA